MENGHSSWQQTLTRPYSPPDTPGSNNGAFGGAARARDARYRMRATAIFLPAEGEGGAERHLGRTLSTGLDLEVL